MDLGLEDKRALVTASSKGLGRAAAAELAREGAMVVISSRNEDNLKQAKSEICEENSIEESNIIPIVCDLSDEEEIDKSIQLGIEKLGGLDILVTNHGGPPSKSFADATLSEFDDAYKTIVKGVISVIDSALPHLENGGGAITNVVSASAQEPPKDHIISNVFRPSIYGLSKGLSREYGARDVRVNCVAPRGIETERLDYKIESLSKKEDISTQEAKEQRHKELPVGRLGSAKEFGKAVAFVSSDSASFTTGSIIEVDGGWTRGSF